MILVLTQRAVSVSAATHTESDFDIFSVFLVFFAACDLVYSAVFFPVRQKIVNAVISSLVWVCVQQFFCD